MSLKKQAAAICGGTIVTEQGLVEGTILVQSNGTIAGLAAPGEEVAADEVVDAAGLLVFPGVIDPHCHLSDPGDTDSEDFFTGTCGAAAGGITTVVDMPQSTPLVASRQVFLDKVAIAKSKSVVDFALYAALTSANTSPSQAALAELRGAGAIAFKAFTCHSPEQPRVPDNLLMAGMEEAARLGLPVTVHCEYDELIEFYKERLRKKGRNDVLVNADSRPPATETEAVHRVLTLGELTGARIHVAHASLPETLSMVMQARARGVSVSAETCPHYLTLTRDDIARIGAYAICNPPLRGVAAVEGLWDSLRRGALDCIGTDHGAYTEELKSNPDYWSMAAGISCIELMFPLIVGEAIKRNIDLSRLSAVFSGNAARLFGLYPKKGALLPGSDADCVLVDPNASWVIHGADLFSKSPGTAFEGIEVRTTVRRTLVRGRTVYLNEEGIGRGRILVRPGFGEFQPGPASSKTGRRSHA